MSCPFVLLIRNSLGPHLKVLLHVQHAIMERYNRGPCESRMIATQVCLKDASLCCKKEWHSK